MLLMFSEAQQCLLLGVKTILNRVIVFGSDLSNLFYFDRKQRKNQPMQGSFGVATATVNNSTSNSSSLNQRGRKPFKTECITSTFFILLPIRENVL